MRAALRALAVTGLTVAAGCGSLTDDPDSPADSHPDCDWKQQRGVAELLAIDEQAATFAFHPGNITVSLAPVDEWSVGQEFKAILETPDRPECGEPHLQELRPLITTD